jgi:hypothetical protein
VVHDFAAVNFHFHSGESRQSFFFSKSRSIEKEKNKAMQNATRKWMIEKILIENENGFVFTALSADQLSFAAFAISSSAHLLLLHCCAALCGLNDINSNSISHFARTNLFTNMKNC